MKRRTSLLALFLLLVSGRTTAAEKPLKEIVFLTNYVFLGRHAPFFVGLEKGYYREAGFDIRILPSTGSGSVIAALEGGKADYGLAEAAPVVQAVGKGAKVKAFGVFMDVSTSGLASLTPFPTPESLVGRTLAASLTDSARVILPIIYRAKDLDPSQLSWLAADPSVYFPMLLQGKAELVTASLDSDLPTFRRIAEPMGKTVYFSSFADWGYDVFGYFLVTRADRIASSPDEVRAFAGATVRAVEDARRHPQEAAEILVRHHPTLNAELMLAHWRQSMEAMETAYVAEHGYAVATPERLQRTIDLVRRAFELDIRPSPDDVYAPGLVAR